MNHRETIIDFGFKDVGELVTQEWYGKMLEVSSKDRKLFDTISVPFTESKPSKQLLVSTLAVTLITIAIAFTNFATVFDLQRLPYVYLLWIMVLLLIYVVVIQVYKKWHLRRNKEWL